MVVSGVCFQRVATVPGGFLEFASHLIPLAILELDLSARESRSANARIVMAILLLAVVVYMCFGTARFAMWVGRNV